MTLLQLEKYAEKLQKRMPPQYGVKKTELKPRLRGIAGVKAVLIDVYGTFLTSAYDDLWGRNEAAFKKTVEEFHLNTNWEKVRKLYYQGIERAHRRKRKKGIQFPEVLIEDIWARILRKIGKKGVNKFRIAYFFDWVRDRNKLYSDAFETLKKLKEQGLKLGIASNSQFYTPINLNILLRKKSRGRIKKWQQFFTPGLCSFSFIEGFSKPNKKIFAKQLKRFKAEEMVFVGNDLFKDIKTAKRQGLHTVLFAGDAKSLRLRKGDKRVKGVKPDAIITSWKQLLRVVG